MSWFLKDFTNKYKKAVLFFFGAFFGSSVLVLPSATFAAVAFDFGLSDLAAIGLGNADIRVIIIRLIRVALGFLGLVAIIIVLYGGYLWMTSAGNEQRVELAKKVLKNGLIGLAIILSAYTIVAFIIGTFINRILNEGGGEQRQGPCLNCSALGGGIIEDHYPGRNATGIPRNDHVSITFKEPIFVVEDGNALEGRSFIADASLMEAPNDAPDNWQGNSTIETPPPPVRPPPPIFLLQEVFSNNTLGPPRQMAVITMRTSQRIFSLYPEGLLGYPDHDTRYRATIKGGAKGLAKAADTSKEAMGGDYEWNFTVSTFLDTTPPKVIDVYPVDGQTEARNVSVVMTFDEPIDPVSIVYAAGSPNTILFHQTPPAPDPDEDVDGVTDVTNGYRTVTFHTSTKCGVNSCGQDIYCFDANAAVKGTIKAATLLGDDRPECPSSPINDALRLQGNPSAACVIPPGGLFFDGIVDMAGNSLDGSPGVAPAPPLPSGNDTANGPPDDNYIWTFNTDDKIVKGGPEIRPGGTVPAHGTAGQSTTDPASATFNRRLLKFTTDDFRFYEQPPSVCLGGANAGKACTAAGDCPGSQCGRFAPTWARQSINYNCGVSDEACFPLSQRKICVGGSRDGQACNKQEDCNPPNGIGGNTCNTIRVCRGGTNDGNACTTASPFSDTSADCPGAGATCPIAACPAPVPPQEKNECGQTTAELNHGAFNNDKGYEPRIGSTVLDIYQNCYYPSAGPDTGVPNLGEQLLNVDDPPNYSP